MKKFLSKEINKFLNFVKKTKSQNTYKTYEIVLNEAINFIEIENNTIDITPYRLHIANLSKKTVAKKYPPLEVFSNF